MSMELVNQLAKELKVTPELLYYTIQEVAKNIDWTKYESKKDVGDILDRYRPQWLVSGHPWEDRNGNIGYISYDEYDEAWYFFSYEYSWPLREALGKPLNTVWDFLPDEIDSISVNDMKIIYVSINDEIIALPPQAQLQTFEYGIDGWYDRPLWNIMSVRI